MLSRLAVLPELAQALDLWEARRDATEALGASLRRRGDLAVQEAETARSALTEAVRARRRAEEDLDAWYRSPTLWFVFGVVASVAVVVVTAYALDAVRSP